MLGETMRQHDVALASVRTDAQADMARAEDRVTELKQEVADRVETQAAAHTAAVRAAAETAQQHDAALAAGRALLDDAEARRMKLGQDLVQVETERRDADTAHVAQVTALEAQVAEQLAAAVREAQAEAAQMLGETMRQHDVALARVRTGAQADAARAEDRVTELKQEVADRVETQTAAQTATMRATAETAQMLAETMKQHNVALARVRGEAQADMALSGDRVTELKQEMADRAEMQAAAHTAAVRALLDDAEARRMKLEQDLVVRVDTVRREADAAQAAQGAALEMQAAEQVAAAVRAAQAEAAQMLGETMRQHDVALARVRAEAQADVARAEDRVTELKQELADRVATHVEMQAAAHTAAVRVAAETAQQHEAALAAVRGQLEDAVARRVKLEQDLVVRVDSVRLNTNPEHAA